MKVERLEKLYDFMKRNKCIADYRCVIECLENINSSCSLLSKELFCIGDHPERGPHSIKKDSIYICNCPIRLYLVNNINKIVEDGIK